MGFWIMTVWSLVDEHQRVRVIYYQDLPHEILNDLKEY